MKNRHSTDIFEVGATKHAVICLIVVPLSYYSVGHYKLCEITTSSY